MQNIYSSNLYMIYTCKHYKYVKNIYHIESIVKQDTRILLSQRPPTGG